tara:strand:+ start:877 stop:1362 length:486 start_codon:yes stop_codon:yes gene_type:complete
MDLGTMIAVGSTVASFFSGGGGGNPQSGSGGMDIGGSGSMSNAMGFATKLAKSYNLARSGSSGSMGNSPFGEGAKISKPATGSYYNKFAKQKNTAPTLAAGNAYSGSENPDLQTAILNLVNNSQNQQMQQLIQEQRVNTTIQQGRKYAGIESPSLSNIKVT